ncbi:MAG: methyl-accepting chemotaxis protein, partial [Desulfobulbus sp.]
DQINKVADIIHHINELISGMAGAVSEQSTATHEITANISQASEGIREVNENINNSSHLAQSIADKIADVNASTGRVLTNSDNVEQRSTALSALAQQLAQAVTIFKLN